ncbi:SRPBCC domain-containing protein [Gynurincola endophyticus]|uniref:SRPBCC domain-containing protein n=1 Tax=Gynurincola endophyticus TaxID=2479004 RepID=UPI000F8E0DC4|nr:SRPBCC domain-containing protein [Gynurincola endophyticus]
MKPAILMNFSVEKEKKQIHVERSFDAPVTLVWKAWTTAEILDKWWAPQPYKVETKKMEFKEGGRWLYAMVGPEGDKHWSFADYIKINPEDFFSCKDGFCDENGNINTSFPRSVWNLTFKADGEQSVVDIVIQYDQLTDLEKIVEMGFKEGFTMGLENLDHYLNTQFQLRKEYKKDAARRATFYLNFPGNTEEALQFYASVFNGKIIGELKRFGDIEAPAGTPPMTDSMKKLIIHGQVELWEGFIIMATDAPEEMGFNVTSGNNMHINIEPLSREEAKRLFDALSAGGKVEHPIGDMFWGAYYASFTDRYGVNWMIHYQQK